MRLIQLKLKDFLTYESLEYDFENRPLLVKGRNLTDDGQQSNGSGKSGIQTGIEYCLTASNSRGVRDNEIITYGKKEANAYLKIACDVRKEYLHIDWTIKLKGANKLNLTLELFDGESKEVSFSNINDGKKYISEWVGITKDDLFNYFLINKVRFKSFFESSNREKVELINRFSDASIVDGIEDIDTDDLQNEIDSINRKSIENETRLQVKFEQLDEELSRDLEGELESVKRQLEDSVQTKLNDISSILENIEDLKEEKTDYYGEIETLQSQIKGTEKTYVTQTKDKILKIEKRGEEISESLDEIKTQLDEFKGVDKTVEIDSVNDQKDSHRSDRSAINSKNSTLKDQLRKLEGIISKVESTLVGTINCPSCDHAFVPNSEKSVDRLKQDKDAATKLIDKIESKIKSNDSDILDIESKLTECDKKINELRQIEQDSLSGRSTILTNFNSIKEIYSKNREELYEAKKELATHEARIARDKRDLDELRKDIESIDKDIERHGERQKSISSEIDGTKLRIKLLRPISNDKNIKDLKSEIKSLEAEAIILSEDLRTKEDELYKLNQWKVNFKKFRFSLANKSLEVIEYHSNRYLNNMGSDMTIKLDGYKTLANGNIKDEITAKVIRNVERSFSSFSGGEKGRVLFASILANRHMINQTHKYGGLDFLSIDEIFEGVDPVGLESLVDSAKKLNISIMIITHVTSENVSSDTLLIEKVGGISRIV